MKEPWKKQRCELEVPETQPQSSRTPSLLAAAAQIPGKAKQTLLLMAQWQGHSGKEHAGEWYYFSLWKHSVPLGKFEELQQVSFRRVGTRVRRSKWSNCSSRKLGADPNMLLKDSPMSGQPQDRPSRLLPGQGWAISNGHIHSKNVAQCVDELYSHPSCFRFSQEELLKSEEEPLGGVVARGGGCEYQLIWGRSPGNPSKGVEKWNQEKNGHYQATDVASKWRSGPRGTVGTVQSQGLASPPSHPAWLRAAAWELTPQQCRPTTPTLHTHRRRPRPGEGTGLGASQSALFGIQGKCRGDAILQDSAPSRIKVLMLSWRLKAVMEGLFLNQKNNLLRLMF